MQKFRRSFLVIFLALICAFCLAFGLTACDLDTSGTSDNTGNTEQTDDDNDDNDDTTTPSTEDDTGTESDDTTTPSTGDDTGTEGDDTTTPSTGDDTGTEGDDTDDTSTTGDPVDVGKLISLFPSDIGDTTMIIKDVSIVFNDGSGDVTIAFDAGEFYLSFVENEGEYLVKAYADGEITITNVSNETMTYEGTLYGDGETAYIMYSADMGENDMQLAITVDYDCMTASSSILEVELLYDADMREMKDMMVYMLLQISPLLSDEQELDPAITKLFEVIAGYSDEVTDISNTMAGYLMTVTTTEDGETVTLDLTAIMQLVKDVYELDVSALADKYIAEGAFDAVTTYLSSLADKKIVDVVTGLTTEAGIDNDTLFAVIDAAVEMVTGEEFDIESILAADGTVEEQYAMIQAIANMTVDELLSSLANTDTAAIVAMISAYKNVNLFSMMFSDASEAAQVYATVNSYLEMIDESLLVSATAYTDGSTETTIECKDLTIATSNVTITANGKITVTSGAEIPADAGDIKTAGSDVYSSLATAVKAIATDGVYTIDDDCYLTVSGSDVKYVNGGTEYTLSADSGLQMLFVGYADEDSFMLVILDTASDTNKMISLELYTDSTGEYYVGDQDVNTFTYNTDGDLASVVEKYNYTDGSSYHYSYTTAYKYTYNSYGWITKEVYTYTNSDGKNESSTTTYTYTVISSETVLGCTVYYVAVVENDDGVTCEYNTYMFGSDLSEIYSNYLQLFIQE